MVKQIVKAIALSLASLLASSVQQVYSAELDGMSSNVYNFQKKLANSGNVQSQFKLGEMLEAGSGVAQDIEQARHWYQQAAEAGYKPAADRLIFLEMKTQGYSKEKHGNWVTGIIARSEARDNFATLLLAQMHREGLGVQKDLGVAKQLLESLVTTGNLSVDKEIVMLDAEILANKKREQELNHQRAEAERLEKLRQAQKSQQAATQAGAEADSVAEKRKRYEEVMRKLQEEQRILKEQQSWAESRE